MTSKERVRRTLRFETPDRVPLDLWVSPSAFLRHGKKLEELLEKHPLDISRDRAKTTGLAPMYRKGNYTDEWGCVWLNLQEGICGEVVGAPIRSWADLASYRPPAPDFDLKTLSACGDRPPEGAFRFSGGIRLFERLQWLRTSERCFMDLAEQPPELFSLCRMLADYNHERIDALLKLGYDGIGFSDDWGSQRSLLISPKLWRELFKPYYKEFFDHVRGAGRFVFFHSDGYILDIMGDLIETGVNALNSQVWCMGVENLAARFRGRLTFWGELDRQSTVPHGAPADIRAAAQRMKAHLSSPAGGLIGQAAVDSLTPLENIEAILEAWD